MCVLSGPTEVILEDINQGLTPISILICQLSEI
jgi:hypothetical protein